MRKPALSTRHGQVHFLTWRRKLPAVAGRSEDTRHFHPGANQGRHHSHLGERQPERSNPHGPHEHSLSGSWSSQPADRHSPLLPLGAQNPTPPQPPPFSPPGPPQF